MNLIWDTGFSLSNRNTWSQCSGEENLIFRSSGFEDWSRLKGLVEVGAGPGGRFPVFYLVTRSRVSCDFGGA